MAIPGLGQCPGWATSKLYNLMRLPTPRSHHSFAPALTFLALGEVSSGLGANGRHAPGGGASWCGGEGHRGRDLRAEGHHGDYLCELGKQNCRKWRKRCALEVKRPSASRISSRTLAHNSLTPLGIWSFDLSAAAELERRGRMEKRVSGASPTASRGQGGRGAAQESSFRIKRSEVLQGEGRGRVDHDILLLEGSQETGTAKPKGGAAGGRRAAASAHASQPLLLPIFIFWNCCQHHSSN